MNVVKLFLNKAASKSFRRDHIAPPHSISFRTARERLMKKLETLMTSYTKKSSLKTLITATALALVAVTAAPSFMASSGAAFAQEGRQFSAKAGEAVNEALQLINSNQHLSLIHI